MGPVLWIPVFPMVEYICMYTYICDTYICGFEFEMIDTGLDGTISKIIVDISRCVPVFYESMYHLWANIDLFIDFIDTNRFNIARLAYNMVNFPQGTYNKHVTTCSIDRHRGYFCWLRLYFLHLSFSCFLQQRVILDNVLTSPKYIWQAFPMPPIGSSISSWIM